MEFAQVLRQRKSVRAFQSTLLTQAQINLVLEEAQLAPSSQNTQPWQVHIVSGNKLAQLQELFCQLWDKQELTPDFTYGLDAYPEENKVRAQETAKLFADVRNIYRGDKEARFNAIKENYFYGAPHAAFFFFPSVGDNVRLAFDLGLYVENFLLSLTNHGFAGVPQTMLTVFAEPLREILGVEPNYKLIIGVSFGYEDHNAPVNQVKSTRVPVEQVVKFHQ
ncbi:hypothetical protein CJP74_02480 [Psittacicella melopsittaci]|uniref:Nitroreductase domain-containing protein n=1 Tax=Psittacicella melopsittaci TaxID=2028576 RepID=A0A3A1Y721_9GAMM|nr:nitroreductase [Psittacicella melopsittaci]RIY33311.1 hypothetical protein CJP74_02480 [Psittacicella melopsittaci]